ncbi:MAG: C45 family autoproteolytic acyltransferase/hydrolase [Bacteroidetes bacterium]|nr:C45 family autoproteolytic acyltransferase/hydrolase [Bacteroidota bacterium]
MKRVLKFLAYTFGFLLLLLLVGYLYIQYGLAPHIPEVKDKSSLNLQREKVGENFYRIGNNWLRKNESGLWEEYIEGEPFERGVIRGKLEKELLYSQEVAFVDQIHNLVPNNSYLKYLGWFTRVFNRHLDENFPEENKLEIYGESFSAPHEFDFINPAYDRMLNYHAAHDIGHALQSLALVGCTSFAAWNERSADSSMIIGRNLDFYLGDKFSENKIVYFCNPKQGNKFVMITWAGFMGCVSGMNEKGITITINAAKSDIPNGATTPISILAREILQYANNIDEAYSIAKRRKTFVCETLMIGSAPDHKTSLIEKSITKTILFNSDTDFILCANHYQSDSFKNDKNNIENIATSASMYRFHRLEELMNRSAKLDYKNVASILRDQRGQQDKNIGIGNEKALNQLISHHAIIFQPEKLRFWVSANPYQEGEFVCYDLKKIFIEAPSMKENRELNETALAIPADSFLLSADWENFLQWRELKQEIKHATNDKKELNNEKNTANNFIQFNPEFWETYFYLGEYYKAKSDKASAKKYFDLALTKEINDTHEADKMREEIKAVQ